MSALLSGLSFAQTAVEYSEFLDSVVYILLAFVYRVAILVKVCI